MLLIKLLLGIILVGSIDRIENSYATIEYDIAGVVYYIDMPVKNAICKPAEGMIVFFDEHKIIKCFKAVN